MRSAAFFRCRSSADCTMLYPDLISDSDSYVWPQEIARGPKGQNSADKPPNSANGPANTPLWRGNLRNAFYARTPIISSLEGRNYLGSCARSPQWSSTFNTVCRAVWETTHIEMEHLHCMVRLVVICDQVSM